MSDEPGEDTPDIQSALFNALVDGRRDQAKVFAESPILYHLLTRLQEICMRKMGPEGSQHALNLTREVLVELAAQNIRLTQEVTRLLSTTPPKTVYYLLGDEGTIRHAKPPHLQENHEPPQQH